jgi:hypothetical protein
VLAAGRAAEDDARHRRDEDEQQDGVHGASQSAR